MDGVVFMPDGIAHGIIHPGMARHGDMVAATGVVAIGGTIITITILRDTTGIQGIIMPADVLQAHAVLSVPTIQVEVAVDVQVQQREEALALRRFGEIMLQLLQEEALQQV